jgi:hypothetical protein
MDTDQIHHRAPMWRWSADGKTSWHFLTIDGTAGEALAATALMRRLELGKARGFGSVRVNARIGGTVWQTSVFPEKGGESWILPIKKAVRSAEDIGEGDEIDVSLEPL